MNTLHVLDRMEMFLQASGGKRKRKKRDAEKMDVEKIETMTSDGPSRKRTRGQVANIITGKYSTVSSCL